MPSDLSPATPSGTPASAASGHAAPGAWQRDDPRHDRAAGAWVGAAAAACMVGAPAAVARGLLAPSGEADAVPARLARLLESALAALDEPGIESAPGSAPERAFARALRAAAATGRVPDAETAADGDVMGAAWRAVSETPVPPLDSAGRVFPCTHLVDAVWRASAVGGDEAAMYAGALAGARWGVSGVPLEAQRRLSDAVEPRELIARAVVLARGSDPGGWPERSGYHTGDSAGIYTPFRTPHPHDSGVLLGNLSHLRERPDDVDAIVSLNRLGPEDVHDGVPAPDRVEVWLADTPAVNPNLHFVLEEAAASVAALRAEGKRVLLHCAAGQSRTPAVAAHYAARSLGADVREALRTVITEVGGHLDNPELARTAAALNGVQLSDAAAELFPEGLPPRRGADAAR
ncbi:dual specificity protein phosphatase family protein [Streptomonospora litoralis]|uniref:Dual specificity phosphatase, catalytic domain n=1 Tax=Streptomonospora litoralis TaxID=2498135 RepID=A0A4P6Q686_9ACTN|nr:dual specificity protein phosphatase family protein [Streptomonospora litoralis]QBI54297.1 Dual specificity phosphatase, catalytic domain [Streptomonospora litoralis]